MRGNFAGTKPLTRSFSLSVGGSSGSNGSTTMIGNRLRIFDDLAPDLRWPPGNRDSNRLRDRSALAKMRGRFPSHKAGDATAKSRTFLRLRCATCTVGASNAIDAFGESAGTQPTSPGDNIRE
jgi:hypothetical protein